MSYANYPDIDHAPAGRPGAVPPPRLCVEQGGPAAGAAALRPAADAVGRLRALPGLRGGPHHTDHTHTDPRRDRDGRAGRARECVGLPPRPPTADHRPPTTDHRPPTPDHPPP